MPTEEVASKAAAVQEKTKAKKRYLKAKKERRKKRKAPSTTVSQTIGDGHPLQAPTREHSQRNSDSEGVDGHEVESQLSDHDTVEKESQQVQTKDSRPRKRQKLGAKEDIVNASTGHTEVELSDHINSSRASPVLNRPKSPTPSIALPSFPAPTRPDPPSRSTLALQGLDKALVKAEIVDPHQLQPFSATDEDDVTGLSKRTRKRLEDIGITELFAVQTAVIPYLLTPRRLNSLYLPYDPPSDLCVSAPTGSGKTLAYVLPIVEILSKRIVTRLRALVVLPTRDLVTQVRETFETVSKGRGLKIGTATGQHSFAHEQAQLVGDRLTVLQGGSSKVDVLICTPGRLIDHLNGTPNFSLQHLRFLVIDEADRLLAQSFQDWLARVLAATRPSSTVEDMSSNVSQPVETRDRDPFDLPRADALAPAFLHLLDQVPYVRTDLDERKESSCQKLLFSATLTRDPAKTAALNLHNPKYFVVQDRTEKVADEASQADLLDLVMEKFSMPATLTEYMIVCESSQKPLMLFHLVHARKVTNALVFTKSAESTSRLVRLFEFFESALAADTGTEGKDGGQKTVAHAYSSDLGSAERKSILEKFRNQEIHILVCSDLVSRGIDISHVSHVVSYDAPVDMRKYVHRAGRTARAGRAGDAWTLVEEQEARHFKSMLREADHLDKVKRVRVSDKDLASLRPAYDIALGHLKDAYARTN